MCTYQASINGTTNVQLIPRQNFRFQHALHLRPHYMSISMTVSSVLPLSHSVLLWKCGMHLAIICCLIPCFIKNSSQTTYFVPLSILKTLISKPLYFSTKDLNCSKWSQASYLCLRKQIHIFQLISSIKINVTWVGWMEHHLKVTGKDFVVNEK